MARSWRILLLAGLVLAAIVVPTAVAFYTDWLWFGETGYREVFLTTLTAQSTRRQCGNACRICRPADKPARGNACAFAPRAGVDDARGPRRIPPRSPEAATAGHFRRARRVAILRTVRDQPLGGVAVVPTCAAVRQSRSDSRQRRELLRLSASVPRGRPRVPARLWSWCPAVASGGVYVLAGRSQPRPEPRASGCRRSAKRHLAVLAAALFLVLAFGAYLGVPRLLTTPAGIIYGVVERRRRRSASRPCGF